MHVISLTGNLGQDPERRTQTLRDGTEQPIAKFTVASNRRFAREGQPSADWFFVTVFGAQAEPCLQHLHKGRLVEVVGRLEITRRPHDTAVDQQGNAIMMTYLDLIADRVTFHGTADPNHQANGNGQTGQQAAPAGAASPSGTGDDGMPF